MTLGPGTAYGVDIFHDRSAESMAASAYVSLLISLPRTDVRTRYNSGLRSFLLSLAVTGILPMINTLGIVLTHTISALLAWAGCL